jgi:predicted DNA-binding helix-hairpin-helix protein
MLLHGVSPDELPFDRSGRLGSAREIRSIVTRPIITVAPYDLATAPLRWLERTPGIGMMVAARLQSYRNAKRLLTDDVLLAVGVDLRRAEPWMERPDFVHRRRPAREGEV